MSFRAEAVAGISTDVLLAPYTTWRIGGPAQFFAQPPSIAALQSLCAFAQSESIPLYVLGRGSNVLIDDEGVDGLVICLRSVLGTLTADAESGAIEVQAGCPMPRIAKQCAAKGIGGLDFLVAIPGSIGAGVAINAGIGGPTGPSLADALVGAEILSTQTGEIVYRTAEALNLSYRNSALDWRNEWIVNAQLSGRPGVPKAEISAEQRAIIARRAAKQPLQVPTSGSVFKGTADGKPAGWYIDQAGLKGVQHGQARISPIHGNWIENLGGARSTDVRSLIRLAMATVQDRFGVLLQPEVRYFGSASAGLGEL